MSVVKLIAIGNSTGAIFPKDVLADLKVERGGALFLSKNPNGGYTLTPYDPEFERQMDVARKVMKKRRAVLRELAK